MPEGFTARDVDVGDAVTHVVVGGAGPAVVLLHLAFFQQWNVPEMLIGGREREYFG